MNIVRSLLIISLLASIPFSSFSQDSLPSFSCEQEHLNITELEICSSIYLSRRDALMDLLYDYAKNNNVTQLTESQVSWLKERNACGSDYDCIYEKYDNRNSYLATFIGDSSMSKTNVLDPKIFVLSKLNGWFAGIPICEEFEDINSDGIAELICFPVCDGAQACGSFFFSSLDNGHYKHHEHLDGTNLSTTDILTYDDIAKLDINTDSGWSVLRVVQQAYGSCEAQEIYFVSANETYAPARKRMINATWKQCHR